MPRRVVELLTSWKGQLESQHILEARKIAHMCLMWCIWRFKDCEGSMLRVKSCYVQISLCIQ